MQLTLTNEDARELRDLLEAALADLRSEIHHTDSSDYRRGLQERDRILRGLWQQLGAGEPARG